MELVNPEIEFMDIVIDGYIYQIQYQGGISRLFTEIIPLMCEIDDSLNIKLLTSGHYLQDIPNHSRVNHYSPFILNRLPYPNRFTHSVVQNVFGLIEMAYSRDDLKRVWHSTYYTLPKYWGGYKVINVYDMIHEHFPDMFDGASDHRFRERKHRCILDSDAIICISDTTRNDVAEFFNINDERIAVIPLSYSRTFRRLEETVQIIDLINSGPFLLYVGTRHEYKNFNGLLAAYSNWARKDEVSLVVVGVIWSADEIRRLKELGIWDRVRLITNVDDQQLCQLYNRAMAFVYPSYYEGFGIPLLEAMACGCPIIASRIPSTFEVAGEVPSYFDPHSMDSLINALDKAISGLGRDDQIRIGLELVKNYSWEKTARQTLDVYNELTQ